MPLILQDSGLCRDGDKRINQSFLNIRCLICRSSLYSDRATELLQKFRYLREIIYSGCLDKIPSHNGPARFSGLLTYAAVSLCRRNRSFHAIAHQADLLTEHNRTHGARFHAQQSTKVFGQSIQSQSRSSCTCFSRISNASR